MKQTDKLNDTNGQNDKYDYVILSMYDDNNIHNKTENTRNVKNISNPYSNLLGNNSNKDYYGSTINNTNNSVKLNNDRNYIIYDGAIKNGIRNDRLKYLEKNIYDINKTSATTVTSSSVNTQVKCSVFETTCNLITVLTGSGMLSLPFAAAYMGWSAVLCLGILACIFMYSFYLLAETIETYYVIQKVNSDYSTSNNSLSSNNSFNSLNSRVGIFSNNNMNIDYLTFGKVSLGQYGDKIVMVTFGTDMILALVSFLINIGININTINSNISPVQGIILAGIISTILALFNLKFAAYSSLIGISMTFLTVAAILMSGLELEDDLAYNPHNHNIPTKIYSTFIPSGTPLSLGLIAFCFGGHAAFPKMYLSMLERARYKEVILYTTIVILSIYATIMISGYYYYAQFTQIPITLNIGRNYLFEDLKGGPLLRTLSAVGIIFNLQVTCPLITFPVRDMLLKMCDLQPAPISIERVVACLVVVVASILALSFSKHFAAMCGLIGSFTTTTNSVVLPILFYHS
eukprot:gene8066-10928_t